MDFRKIATIVFAIIVLVGLFFFGKPAAPLFGGFETGSFPNTPDIAFNTPANGSSYAQNTSIWLNATLNLTGGLSNLTYNYDGANFTLYNASLILAYDFDNVAAIGENATRCVDTSLAGNNGTFLPAGAPPVWNTSGYFGGGLTFNTTPSITTPLSVSALNTSTGFTVFFRYNRPAESTNEHLLGFAYNQAPEISSKYGGGVSMIITQISCESAWSNYTYGKWHDAFFEFNGTHMNGWIDGYKLTGGACPNAYAYIAGYDAITIGAGGGLSGFNGSLDTIRIWNRTLTEAEIAQVRATNLAKYSATNWTFTAIENLTQANHDYQFQLWAANTTHTNTTFYQFVTTNQATPDLGPNVILYVPQNNTNQTQNLNITFNYTVTDDKGFTNSTLFIWLNGTTGLAEGEGDGTTTEANNNYMYGYNITTTKEISITGIRKMSQDNSTTAYIYAVNKTRMRNATFSGDIATFSPAYNLTSGTTAYCVVGDNYTAHTRHYVVASSSYPISKTGLTINSATSVFWLLGGENFADISNPNGIREIQYDVISTLWKSFANTTAIINNTNVSQSINLSVLGNFTWNAKVCDNSTAGNCSFAPANFSFNVIGLDTTPPVTTCNSTGTWQNKDQYIALNGTDASGIKNTTHWLNGVNESTAVNFSIAIEANTTISFHSVDNFNNTEANKTCYAAIDKTAPTISSNAPSPASWQTTNYYVNYTIVESLSGWKNTSVWKNGTFASNNYSLIDSEGNWTLVFSACDNAENCATNQTRYAALDKAAPTINVTSPYPLSTTNNDSFQFFNATYVDAFNNISVAILGLNGVNTSLICVPNNATSGYCTYNETSNYVPGQNNYTIWMNDTLGNSNFSSGNVTRFTNISATFFSQSPSDINSENVLGTSVNLTYNMTSVGASGGINQSTIRLYYMTNTATSDTSYYINGTAFSGWLNQTYSANASDAYGDGSYDFALPYYYVYSATYNLNQSKVENTPHAVTYLLSPDYYFKIQFQNLSTLGNYYLFVNVSKAASTEPLSIYYCNSSYAGGIINSSPWCAEVYSLSLGESSIFSNYKIVPLAISGARIRGIVVTSTAYFIYHTTSTPGWGAHYVSNISRVGSSQVSADYGSSWLNLSGTFDAFVVQLAPTSPSTFRYYACFDTISPANTYCASNRTDAIGLVSRAMDLNFSIRRSSSWAQFDSSNKINFSNCSLNAYCEPQYQNASLGQSIFNMTNNGSASGYLYLRQNESKSFLTVRCGTNETPLSSSNINLTVAAQNVLSNFVTVNQSLPIYCWLYLNSTITSLASFRIIGGTS